MPVASAELHIPPTNTGLDWPRRVANAVNPMLGRIKALVTRAEAIEDRVTAAETAAATLTGRIAAAEGDIAALEGRMTDAETAIGALNGYKIEASAPASPIAGQTYYDTTLAMMRTWDGAAWRDHWTV